MYNIESCFFQCMICCIIFRVWVGLLKLLSEIKYILIICSYVLKSYISIQIWLKLFVCLSRVWLNVHYGTTVSLNDMWRFHTVATGIPSVVVCFVFLKVGNCWCQATSHYYVNILFMYPLFLKIFCGLFCTKFLSFLTILFIIFLF